MQAKIILKRLKDSNLYEVVQTENTLVVKVGDRLNEESVRDYINVGFYKIVIRGKK